jgi:hypothetical protein
MDRLELLFQIIFEQSINDYKINYVDIDIDNYWLISIDTWTVDLSPNPCIFSLVDDWNYLREILNNRRIVNDLDYERLASILRAICKTINDE